ncbi:microcystin degradation protein MlrC [Propionibacteriaceae bacterium ES.041]|uniref:Microcystin degradation protein MlrC n=1 Tax=Enemella evansiae TaxID=2016499 RepID=A0A255GP80_9ACTN|nr:M81 family metallopeptidase [Enemella evansiae]OYO02970.1 microcystin degradation protein MlrC [Enemella evansiae]OYO17381.1 microcystin degradation protein MlrC [Enemella evansiae]PFG69283.1 microcystin degradation protein MlrC [Propionibacteriaceae bacterium ES.041]
MTRVLVAGFLHETNTFARTPAGWENFVNGEGFPRMHRGVEIFELAEVNIPMGGFLTSADPEWKLVPVIWCAASPSAPVTRDAFERVSELIVEACRTEQPDAVYLDLHGAMVTEDFDDGDGELLRRVRDVVGPDMPIAVSLDLHANVTELMLTSADAMVAYRTYPHVDMAETGVRSTAQLRVLLGGGRLHAAAEQLDFLIPINSGSTLLEPARGLYAELEELESEGVVLTFAAGFPAADFPDCRPCVFGYGPDEEAVRRVVAELAGRVAAAEAEFVLQALPADRAVARAGELVAEGSRPVVIADTQDNPGAGGDATSLGLLRELLAADVEGTVLAALWYPEVARAATEAGVGATVTARFAGSGVPGDEPLETEFEVEALNSGELVFDGPMMHGNRLSVGPSCLLRHGNVRVVVNAHKAQIMDRNQIRAAGLDPEDQAIVAVKSSVHFRGDYQPMAAEVLVALAPGPMQADPAGFTWQRLTAGVRLGPLGTPFAAVMVNPH